jgi:hypothetical protein
MGVLLVVSLVVGVLPLSEAAAEYEANNITKLAPNPNLVFDLQRCSVNSPWTIHGLWPQWGTCCSGPTFSLNAIADLVPALDREWPSCPQFKTSNVDFWTHEWKKHGTCSGLSQHTYFQNSLQLLRAYAHHCAPVSSTTVTCRLCFSRDYQLLAYSQCQTTEKFPNC